jgi:CBS domain-containing protein
MSGAPVIDGRGRLVGFISEFDILRAYEERKDGDGHLHGLLARDIMTENPVTVKESTTILEALRLMKDNHWLNLPVEIDGVVEYSVTRHDLLRAYTGIGLGTEA